MTKTSVKAYLQLIRLPNVFTAGADSFAGWSFAGGSAPFLIQWPWLIFASMAIYAGGIALNDVFDVEIDRVERPQRPIPSGRVPYRIALGLGISLPTLGLILAGLTREPRTFAVAFFLVIAVLIYDGLLRTTRFGPLVMGLCRSLNLLLGMSLNDSFLTSPLAWTYVVAYGTFVTGVTWISRNETTGGSRHPLKFGTSLQILAIAGLVFVVFGSRSRSETTKTVASIGFLLALGGSILSKDWSAIAAPNPQTIQKAVKTAILSLVWLHFGVILGVEGFALAILVALFWIPAMTTGRWIYST